MSFNNIIGNENIKELLDLQIENNHIVHSYLFVGIEGIGKELFAIEFAKKVLCLNKEKEENCSSCIKFNSRKSSRFLSNKA